MHTFDGAVHHKIDRSMSSAARVGFVTPTVQQHFSEAQPLTGTKSTGDTQQHKYPGLFRNATEPTGSGYYATPCSRGIAEHTVAPSAADSIPCAVRHVVGKGKRGGGQLRPKDTLLPILVETSAERVKIWVSSSYCRRRPALNVAYLTSAADGYTYNVGAFGNLQLVTRPTDTKTCAVRHGWIRRECRRRVPPHAPIPFAPTEAVD